MVRLAPPLSPRLHAAILAADDPLFPIAEVCRRVGARADELGLTRPSYETVRRLIHARRMRRVEPTTADVLVDVALRVRPPDALVAHLAGTPLPGPRA